LKQGTSNDPEVVSVFRKQRANRFIIEYLLRNGYFETAQKLAEYVNAENINKNVFHVAKQVEESLKRRDLSICLHWVLDNRSKLHRLQSSFENEVRTQQLIELIKDGKKLEAVNFMRTYYGNTNNPSDKWTNTVMQVS
jgi:macrophage erythroblast attacher